MKMRRIGSGLFLLATGLALALAGQKAKVEDLSGVHKEFLKLTSYIMLPQEKEVFLTLRDDWERDIFMEAFWKQRDPTPGTPDNEFKAEHVQRFDYANKHFSRGAIREGWMTDMGRIHIILGPPASIERFEMTMGLYPTQVWYYYGDVRKGLPIYFGIIFFQKSGVGEYRLYDHTADGPGSLMIHTRTASALDFSQLYEDLREMAPTLADVAISMIPGETPYDYQPSPMNALIMADIFESPKRSVSATYATHFMKYKGIVSTEYMTNFVESEALAAVIRDPYLGLNFLHVSIVPKHLSVDYYEPKDQYFCNFEMNVSLKLDEHIVFQQTRNFPVYFTPAEFEQIKMTGIAFEDTFPVVNGEFDLAILLQNSVGKEFSLFEKKVAITEGEKRPLVVSPLLGYKTEQYGRDAHIPFKIQERKIGVDPKNTFSKSEELSLFLSVANVSKAFWEDGLLDVAVNPVEPNKVSTKTSTIRLKDYPFAQTMPIFFPWQGQFFAPGYYDVKITLRDGRGDVVQEEKANFIISPSDSVAHPTAYLNGFPLSESYMFFYMLGRQFDRIKDYENAEKAFEKALSEKPDYRKGFIEYAEFLFKIRKFGRSLELIEQVKDDPNLKFPYFFIKGKALMGMEKYEEAMENLLAGNEIYNSDTSLLNALGFCYYKTGQKDKALEVLNASLKLNTEQPEVRKLIGVIEK